MSSPRIQGVEGTTTTVVDNVINQHAAAPPENLTLFLRERPGITWSEDTIDNEGLGRKSSKRCCIFHKVKKFADSDSDESDEDIEKAKKDAEERGNAKLKNLQRHHA